MEKETLIKKWLNDELNEAELEAFNGLEDTQLHQSIIESAKDFKASHFSGIVDFGSFKHRYLHRKKPVKKLSWAVPLLKIASIIVIAVGVYFAIYFFSPTQIETLAGEKTSIELPDNSIVLLNALSSIEYNEAKWETNRLIKLEGEAYFKVAKGKKFDVLTASGIITVMGTEFNVKQRNEYFEVICFEGIVSVSSGSIKRILRKGDTYRILDGKFAEGKTTSSAPNWATNMSDFDAVPFKEVLADLERQYNIQVTIKNVDTDRLFTGSFVHDNLENALTSITHPMNITYAFNSANQVVISGKNN